MRSRKCTEYGRIWEFWKYGKFTKTGLTGIELRIKGSWFLGLTVREKERERERERALRWERSELAHSGERCRDDSKRERLISGINAANDSCTYGLAFSLSTDSLFPVYKLRISRTQYPIFFSTTPCASPPLPYILCRPLTLVSGFSQAAKCPPLSFSPSYTTGPMVLPQDFGTTVLYLG